MNRLLVPRIIVLLVFAALIARLYQLQMTDTEASRFRYATEVRTTRYIPIRPMRGEVFANDGKTLLAESVPIYTVSIRPADLPPTRSRERAEVFAHLAQILGMSSTLTISPALALEQDAVLRSDLMLGLGLQNLSSGQQYTLSLPIRLSVPPARSIEAVALVEKYGGLLHFSAVSTPQRSGDLPPQLQPTLDASLARLSSVLAITGTLSISPAMALEQNQSLRADLSRLLGAQALAAAQPRISAWAVFTIAPARMVSALKLANAYTDTINLTNPIAAQVDGSDVPGYETLAVKRDIPRDVALVLRENADTLPGVVVEQDYRRFYPLSNEVKSLSHTLGYIGRIGQCELVRENAARSWIMGLLDSIGNTVDCGVIQKEIDPRQLGRPRYLSDDRIGKDGVEASYESDLRGQIGVEAVVVDAYGHPVRVPQIVQPARDGANLMLTIDVPLQRQVELILRNWIAEAERRRPLQPDRVAYKRDFDPIRSGVAIVTEVHTGRILAMASWPAYDNNVWIDASRAPELRALLNPPETEQRKVIPLLNRAIAGQYPPGSTLKQFDAVVALQNGIITPETKVRDPGKLVVEDQFVAGRTYTYVNAGSRDNGEITVSDALKVSSNIFFMSVAGGNSENVLNLKPEERTIEEGLGIPVLAEGLGWFGFGERTGVRIAGEAGGRVPTPSWKQRVLRAAWTTGDTYNAAIGQGNLEVTPLQLVNAGATVANGGILYQPQIVRAITDSSGQILQEILPQPVRRVPIDSQHFVIVREGMRRSVTEGVNIAARDECSGLQIAGKTGTAEFGPLIELPPLNGKPQAPVRQSHAWFVGFAPYDNPKIEVLVLVEGSGDMNDGSATITVPAVTQIMQAYFGVQPPLQLPRGCQAGMPPLPRYVGPGEEAVPLSSSRDE